MPIFENIEIRYSKRTTSKTGKVWDSFELMTKTDLNPVALTFVARKGVARKIGWTAIVNKLELSEAGKDKPMQLVDAQGVTVKK
jgi:hypothetical protein